MEYTAFLLIKSQTETCPLYRLFQTKNCESYQPKNCLILVQCFNVCHECPTANMPFLYDTSIVYSINI